MFADASGRSTSDEVCAAIFNEEADTDGGLGDCAAMGGATPSSARSSAGGSNTVAFARVCCASDPSAIATEDATVGSGGGFDGRKATDCGTGQVASVGEGGFGEGCRTVSLGSLESLSGDEICRASIC